MTALSEMPAVLTVEEAARLLRIGRSAAYEAVRRGDIPVIKLGRSLRVPRHKLEAMLGEIDPLNDVETSGQPVSTSKNGVTAPHGAA